MGHGRKQYSAEYKFQVALAAARNDKTVSQLASEYGVHPTQINEWKRQFDEGGVADLRSPGWERRSSSKGTGEPSCMSKSAG